MLPEIISLAGIGFLASLGLGIAAKKLAVKEDPRLEKILEALPGANCGGCGYAGCAAFARAVLEDEAPIEGCVAGGESTALKVAEVLGRKVEKTERMVAFVACHGSKTYTRQRFIYQGIDDCRAAVNVGGGSKACAFGCLGLGSCQKVCPFGAITIEDDLAKIDPEECVGCGLCVDECPRNIIHLVPARATVQVLCSSQNVGKTVKDFCDVGCIGCRRCERACPFNAINVIRNVAVIDPAKCRTCGICMEVCPQDTIRSFFPVKKVAKIDAETCISCGRCEKACLFEAITGEKGVPYTVNPEKCKGCGLCVEQCKVKAITMEEES